MMLYNIDFPVIANNLPALGRPEVGHLCLTTGFQPVAPKSHEISSGRTLCGHYIGLIKKSSGAIGVTAFMLLSK